MALKGVSTDALRTRKATLRAPARGRFDCFLHSLDACWLSRGTTLVLDHHCVTIPESSFPCETTTHFSPGFGRAFFASRFPPSWNRAGMRDVYTKAALTPVGVVCPDCPASVGLFFLPRMPQAWCVGSTHTASLRSASVYAASMCVRSARTASSFLIEVRARCNQRSHTPHHRSRVARIKGLILPPAATHAFAKAQILQAWSAMGLFLARESRRRGGTGVDGGSRPLANFRPSSERVGPQAEGRTRKENGPGRRLLITES